MSGGLRSEELLTGLTDSDCAVLPYFCGYGSFVQSCFLVDFESLKLSKLKMTYPGIFMSVHLLL